MNSYKKFFYIFVVVLSLLISIALGINYMQKENLRQKILQTQAQNLITFVNAFRNVYQERFLKNHIDLNKKTVKLIPVATIPIISHTLSDKISGKVEIKLISDRPRNAHNLANKDEMKIIKKFIQSKSKKPIIINDGEHFIYYQPLYIKETCLKCHSTKSEAPAYIKNNFNNSYGYKLGDFRGAIVIQIDNSKFIKILHDNFRTRLIIALLLYTLILLIVYVLIKKIEEQDKNHTKKLLEINEKLIKEKQKAEINAKVKAEFLANMSHEIRTPLNAMFGFIRLLEEKKLDNESKKYLEIIEKSGETLLSVINDILDFSKIESGKLSIEKIAFNPKEEIETIYNLFEAKANEKNISLYIRENNLDYCIISDPIRIKQVISNLLSNAIKFTPENKNIYLNLSYDDKAENLYVEVIDEGIGIPKDKILSIFAPFTQADTSTTRKYGGTGLGLTISYNLVKLLGGELKVESEENKGSKFYFSIPAKKTEKRVKKEKPKIDNEIFNYHILIAEDNKANQMFMGVVLKKLGLTFDIANDGIEAVEKYKQNYKKYRLILMDENMPNMTGSEATIKIREFEKENGLESIFIVAITANSLSGDRDRFIDIGMDEYIAKPIDIEKLKNILRKIK